MLNTALFNTQYISPSCFNVKLRGILAEPKTPGNVCIVDTVCALSPVTMHRNKPTNKMYLFFFENNFINRIFKSIPRKLIVGMLIILKAK
jgi:hypothetical protein